MQLISEILEDALELKMVSKYSDSVRGQFMCCETTNNTYDDNWNITNQTVETVVKNSKEKIIQETSLNTKFKTDKLGNVTESDTTVCLSIDDIEVNHQDFRMQYDDKGRLISKYGDTTSILPNGTPISLVLQVDIKYDEYGNFKMITQDYIPKNYSEEIRQLKDIFTKQVYLFEYDDENQIQSVNMMTFYHDYFDRGSSVVRYSVEYRNGIIYKIHQNGTDEYTDEVFTHFTDGTITVTKNEYDNGVVVDKTTVTFINPYTEDVELRCV